MYFLAPAGCVSVSGDLAAPLAAPELDETEPVPKAPLAEPPPDGRVTLPQLLAWAAGHSPVVLRGCGELARGEAEVRAAQVAQPFNPTLRVGLGQRFQAGGSGLDAEIGLEQELELAGQRRRRLEAARRHDELTDLGLDAAGWEAHASVHFAFERTLLARDELALAEALVAFERELLAAVERKVELGDESPVMAELASAELALAETEATAAVAEVEAATLALAQASGWPLASPLQPVGDSQVPSHVGEHDVLVTRALDQSPVLREADKVAELARAQVEVARREAWPSLTLGLRYAHEGSTTTAANFNPASNIWMGSVTIPIPTFSRGQASIARQRAQLEVSRSNQRATSTEFVAMVETAAVRVDAAAERARTLEQRVVPAFDRSLSALRRAHEIGELDFLAVAQARERVWAARRQVFEARADYYAAFAELERLVGPLQSGDQLNPTDYEAPTCEDAR